MDHDAILINQVFLSKLIDKLAAAEHQDVLTRLVLELCDFLGDISLDQLSSSLFTV